MHAYKIFLGSYPVRRWLPGHPSSNYIVAVFIQAYKVTILHKSAANMPKLQESVRKE